jgi:hypothetical protein
VLVEMWLSEVDESDGPWARFWIEGYSIMARKKVISEATVVSAPAMYMLAADHLWTVGRLVWNFKGRAGNGIY